MPSATSDDSWQWTSAGREWECSKSVYYLLRALGIGHICDTIAKHLTILDCESLVRAIAHFYDGFLDGFSHNTRRKADEMTLWMGVMMHIDDRLLTHAHRRLVEIANWQTASTAAATVSVLCWDSARESVAGGLRLFPVLQTFLCRDPERVHMQLMYGSSSRYGIHVRLPEELVLCTRLRFIDLSYSSFNELPSAWKEMTTLECVDLSYNQELKELPN